MRLSAYIKKGIIETLQAGRNVYYNSQRGVLVNIVPIPNMRWEDGHQLYRGTINHFLKGTKKDFDIWLTIKSI